MGGKDDIVIDLIIEITRCFFFSVRVTLGLACMVKRVHSTKGHKKYAPFKAWLHINSKIYLSASLSRFWHCFMLSISQLFLSTVNWSNDPYNNGALIIYVNRWCRPVFLLYFVKVVLCCQDLELLAVSLQPYYLKREFSQVIAICVFIPPRADAATACETIHSTIGRLQTQYPEAVFSIILL